MADWTNHWWIFDFYVICVLFAFFWCVLEHRWSFRSRHQDASPLCISRVKGPLPGAGIVWSWILCWNVGLLYICIYIYIYTWNPTDLYFWRLTPQSKAFSDENKGHLGSRYVSTLFTYLCVFFEFLFWLFSGDGCSATNFVLDNSTWIIHTPNSPKTIFSIHLRTWRCPAAKGKSSTIRFWVPMLAFRSFVDPHAEKKAFHGLSRGPTSVVDTARSGPESCQFHSSGVGVAQISKRWWSWVMWWWNLAWLFVCLARSFARGSLSFRCEMLVVLIVKVVLLVYLPQCTFDFQEYLDECRTAKLFVAMNVEDSFKYYTDSWMVYNGKPY